MKMNKSISIEFRGRFPDNKNILYRATKRKQKSEILFLNLNRINNIIHLMVEELHRLKRRFEFRFVSNQFETDLMLEGRFAFDLFNSINYINN